MYWTNNYKTRQLRTSGTDTPRKELCDLTPFIRTFLISSIIPYARGDSLVRYRRLKRGDCDFSSHDWSLTRCIRNCNNSSRQADSRIFMN